MPAYPRNARARRRVRRGLPSWVGPADVRFGQGGRMFIDGEDVGNVREFCLEFERRMERRVAMFGEAWCNVTAAAGSLNASFVNISTTAGATVEALLELRRRAT